MARSQDNSSFVFFVAFLTSLVVSVGSSLVMHMVVLPRIAVSGPRPATFGSPAPDATANTQVPPLVGLPMEQARSLLSSSGLRMALGGQQYDPSQSVGSIVSQNPAQGTITLKGTEIKVVISLGVAPSSSAGSSNPLSPSGDQQPRGGVSPPPPVTGQVLIPSVTGISLTRARKLLEEKGLKVGQISYETDDDLAPNWILRQSPAPKSRASAGSAVNLVVNKE